MFAKITCPACSHKFSVPEAAMGKRQSCPNCQSYFVAGKSTAEAAEAPVTAAVGAANAGAAGFNKTMLADTSPAIRFNCPRCKKPIEAPSSEAGTKMACPGCSQRLQVPAAPAPAPAAAFAATPAAAGINKTMLVDSGPPIRYNCPACKKPLEAGSSEALTKKPCPSCGQRHQVPAAAAPKNNLNKTMLATESTGGSFPSDSYASNPSTASSLSSQQPAPSNNNKMIFMIGGGVIVILFMLIVLASLMPGTKKDDPIAKLEYERKIEQMKNEVDQRRGEFDRQKEFESKIRRDIENLVTDARNSAQRSQDRLNDLIRNAADEKQRQKYQDELDREQRRLADERREADRKQQQILDDAKAKLEESKRALDAAAQKQQTIIQQPPPPPVIYYPPYHPRYYWWW